MAKGKNNRQHLKSKVHSVPSYASDSDDSDTGPIGGPIPLQSLEHGNVRDFMAELESEHSNSRKLTSKRTRAELEQLQQDKQKKKRRDERAEKVVWRKFDRENPVFEQYYQRILSLCPNEWKELITSLKEPMSVYVRINSHYSNLSEIVMGTLDMDFQLNDVKVTRSNGEETNVDFKPVSWGTNKQLWKLTIDSKSFRKAKILQELNTYFQTQINIGLLQRMDPLTSVVATFLDVSPGHCVLDLCGGGELRAPAIIELLGNTGALIVNEVDAAKAAHAVQSLSRTLALSRATVVTAHKPIDLSSVHGQTGAYDRVLCCAPSSGDGLIRKIPEKWRTWTPTQGLDMHICQAALLRNAMALVLVGGKLLYSTRSMNPIENEAVVADLIRSGNGAYELEDVSSIWPTLARSPGLKTWEVVDDKMNSVAMWETATPAQRKHLRASMWPPTEVEQDSLLHLERCVRILPHHNDTNALFIAVIKHVRLVELPVAGPEPAIVSVSSQDNKQRNKKVNKKQSKVLGSLSMIDANGLQIIQSFYGLEPNDLQRDQVMERSGFSNDKSLHVVTPRVSQLLQTVFQGRVNVHRAGVETFKRVSATAFELTDDGARTLLPVLRRRVLQLSMDEFATFLQKKEMWLKNASESTHRVVKEMEEGSLVVVLDDMEPMQTADQDILVLSVKRHNSYSLVSTSASIARIKTLMKELEANEEEGYDSFEYEDEE